ncbi:unnamed protein product [Cylicocyclus nassatus]|uniref:SKA complex subunit 1 n=1 Tax=Cylicocyclus nassatus TaxID=53992 RepID=A0AA36DTA6_CYLNA|nr:unnamed protein product [Cylicocyclus nassatus]
MLSFQVTMVEHIMLPLKEEHLAPILDRRDQVVDAVQSILPHAKIEKGTRTFNEKLKQLQQLMNECSIIKAELDQIPPLEQAYTGIGDVLRKENLLVEYPTPSNVEISAKSTSAKSDDVAPVSEISEQAITAAAPEVTEADRTRILKPISAQEFADIPKYMKGRMTCAELNEIVSKLDEFLSQKRRLLNAPFKKLPMKDKDQVSKWKEQETASLTGKLFCQEADVKPMMNDRSRALFRTAAPCLRHVHRIREVREKGRVYLLPY